MCHPVVLDIVVASVVASLFVVGIECVTAIGLVVVIVIVLLCLWWLWLALLVLLLLFLI